MALPQLAIGVWALASPHGWFDNFPGAGQHWLPAYGAFDGHLVADVGSTFTAIAVLLLIAAALADRRVTQVAIVTYLVYSVPHYAFHLAHDDVLSGGAQIANAIAIGLSIAAAGALLVFVRRGAHG